MKNPIHLALIVIVLIGSDMIIGFVGHYIGSGQTEITPQTIVDYLNDTPLWHWLAILAVAIIVCVIVHFLGG